jgi:hypothetical protein
MKAVLKLILILSLSILFFSCEEDEDRNFQTNLSQEANQLFGISTAWGESLYFGLLNFEDFSQIPSTELPGCPGVLIETAEKRIILTFDPTNVCEQSGKVKRTGKLILQYPLISTNSSPRTLTYKDYTFRNDTIRGTREFSITALNQVKETFVNLKTTSKKDLNSTFSGILIHSLTKLRIKLIGFSSSGSISGTNSTGRTFSIEISSPRQSLATCFSQNEILPIAGKEKWIVDRGQSRVVIHSINYETSGSCGVTAKVTLSDGRNLLVIP